MRQPQKSLLRRVTPGLARLPAPPETIEDQHRRHLINDPLPPHRGMPRIIQMTVRLGCRQPFVPKMHRNPELRPQILGKCLRLDRLRAQVAGHIQRISHDNLGHFVLPEQPGHRLHICLASRSMQRKQRLCRVPKRVGDRQPNSPVPYVKSDNPTESASSPSRRRGLPG